MSCQKIYLPEDSYLTRFHLTFLLSCMCLQGHLNLYQHTSANQWKLKKLCLLLCECVHNFISNCWINGTNNWNLFAILATHLSKSCSCKIKSEMYNESDTSETEEGIRALLKFVLQSSPLWQCQLHCFIQVGITFCLENGSSDVTNHEISCQIKSRPLSVCVKWKIILFSVKL